LLEDAHYHVTVAANGKEGLDMALQERPELIISDFMMPILSGLEMIAKLHEAGYTNPILLCSAIPETQLPTERPSYGAFLRKPYSGAELLDAVTRLRKKANMS